MNRLDFIGACIDAALAFGAIAVALLAIGTAGLIAAAGYLAGTEVAIRIHCRGIRRLENYANHPANRRREDTP